MLGGDLVEESDQPFFGDDSFPLEWPLTLDLVLGLMTAATVVVPGHGQIIDQDYVQDQRVELGDHRRDHPRPRQPRRARLPGARAGRMALGPALLASAVRLGYEHLPRGQKRLPLV